LLRGGMGAALARGEGMFVFHAKDVVAHG
jgi:hypothetical protein